MPLIFIIESARRITNGPLVVVAIGKLTNLALAIERAPDIESQIRLVWLGSNYPEAGEYNLMADRPSVNRILNSQLDFEIVTVRYTQKTGSTAVAVSTEDVKKKMPSLGPKVPPVEGRHGGEFTCFGDYAISLFETMNFPKRPLFDVVAVAVVKNPAWGEKRSIPAPILADEDWVERPDSARQISLWENFDRGGILNDMFESMQNYRLPS